MSNPGEGSAGLDGITAQLRPFQSETRPPIERWDPALSGDIDIRIQADGTWMHEGEPIRREALVNLFASILRREQDGCFYLITPVEKWRIRVDLHPLLVVDIDTTPVADTVSIVAVLNTGWRVRLGSEHPLFLEPAVGDVAVVELDRGLTALFNRNAWYRLVDVSQSDAEGAWVTSGGQRFRLSEAG